MRRATQGLAGEILDCGAEFAEKGVVIAHDSRNNSRTFALEAANVLCANGIKTYLFDGLRPTPELSFAVRYLGCARGIVITASHNPKEYNGYKVYGDDGGQIPPGVADKIIKYIDNTDIFGGVKLCENPEISIIGEEVDVAYINAVKEQSLGTEIPDDFRVVYTPLHGSGNIPVRRILAETGVENVFTVPEQEEPDGDFPTVKSPNPENSEAFDIAVEYAKKQNADLVFGTDPDSDRIGVVVKTTDGDYKVLNGNQTGCLLLEFILRKEKENGILPKNGAVVKTIVTSELVRRIADDYGIVTIDVLTGFKFIGEKIKKFEESGEHAVSVEAFGVCSLPEIDFNKTDVMHNYLSYKLLCGGDVVSEGTVLFTAPKHFEFEDPALSYIINGDSITVTAKNFAKYVEIDSPDSDFVLSDNYFDLNGGESKTVRITEGEPKTVRLRSAYDIK